MNDHLSRDHHYLPKHLTRWFAREDRHFEMWDKSVQEWRTVPHASQGFQRDLYRVDVFGQPIDHVERVVMGELDGRTSDVVSRILLGKPVKPDAAHVLRALVTSTAARHPMAQNGIDEELVDPDRPARDGAYPSVDGAHALFMPLDPRHGLLLDHRDTSPNSGVSGMPIHGVCVIQPKTEMVLSLNHAALTSDSRFLYSNERVVHLPVGVSLD